jgi:inner membrane transporter RhtA
MGLGGMATLPVAVGLAGSALVEPVTLALCLLLGTLIGISITLEINALRRMPARAFGILLCFEPVLAALVGWVTLGQELAALQLLGIAAVVAAGIGTTAFAQPVPTPE